MNKDWWGLFAGSWGKLQNVENIILASRRPLRVDVINPHSGIGGTYWRNEQTKMFCRLFCLWHELDVLRCIKLQSKLIVLLGFISCEEINDEHWRGKWWALCTCVRSYWNLNNSGRVEYSITLIMSTYYDFIVSMFESQMPLLYYIETFTQFDYRMKIASSHSVFTWLKDHS